MLFAPAKSDPRAEIDGRVIDAATGNPIEGAVVVATWWTELSPNPAALALGVAGIGGHGEADRRTAYVSEAITDREGRFTIPAWSASRQWRAGGLTPYSPLIRFVARGYSPAAATSGRWTTGLTDHLTPGLRGARQMALYRPGQRPSRTWDALAHFEGAAHSEPEVRRLLALTRARPVTGLADDAPEQWGAEVAVRLIDGRTFTSRVDSMVGAVGDVDRELLREKFMDCAVRAISPEAAGRVFAALEDLEGAPDLRAIAELLAARQTKKNALDVVPA